MPYQYNGGGRGRGGHYGRRGGYNPGYDEEYPYRDYNNGSSHRGYRGGRGGFRPRGARGRGRGGYQRNEFNTKSHTPSGHCTFYYKIGACRHGARCSRIHAPPHSSNTIMIPNFYENPLTAFKSADEIDPMKGRKSIFDKKQELDPELEEFYVDVFEQGAKYGELEDVIISDNLCDHLVGNVYLKYFSERDAEKAVEKIDGRYYAGRQIKAVLTPVSDFGEARCRQFHEEASRSTGCNRHGDCNFLHTLAVNPKLIRILKDKQKFAKKRSDPANYNSDSEEKQIETGEKHGLNIPLLYSVGGKSQEKVLESIDNSQVVDTELKETPPVEVLVKNDTDVLDKKAPNFGNDDSPNVQAKIN